MAATYTQNITPFSGSYNATVMVYRFVGSFTAHDVLAGQAGITDVMNHRGLGDWSVGDWAAPRAALPAYRSITHLGNNVFGTAFNQSLRCYPSERQGLNTTTDSTHEVGVTMEGRVLGTHDISPRVQMTSEILFTSLRANNWPNAAPDVFDGIGLDFAGAPRDVPMEVYDVSKCVLLSSLELLISWANDIAGSVNELNWEPPWSDQTVTPGVGIAEGAYLYFGATNTVVDRNTRTAMVTHSFARLQSRKKQQIFEWLEYAETWDETAQRKIRVYDDKTYDGYIQKVAGTDSFDTSYPVAGSIIRPFWTLLLGNIVF